MILFFWIFYSVLLSFHKNIKQHNIHDRNKKVSWAPNQRIRMISKGSCDTEDWSNNWKFSFAITEINYILKYIKIKNS